MPTEEQNVEELKQLIGQTQQSPIKEPSNEDKILFYMMTILELLRDSKPDGRSDKARRYAIAITEMEKLFAYFKVYIVDFIGSDDKLD